MLFDEIQVARYTRSIIRSATVTTTRAQFIPANPNRVTIILLPRDSGAYKIIPSRAASSVDGIYVEPLGQPIVLSMRDWGILVAEAWDGDSVVGSIGVTCLEVEYVGNAAPPAGSPSTPGSPSI